MVLSWTARGLRCPADVAMMQATEFRDGHDPALLGELDWPDIRRILVEREVRASPVIVREIRGQDASQICFEHHDYSIKVLDSVIQDESWFAFIAAADEGDD
jgi:hypothetical protein